MALANSDKRLAVIGVSYRSAPIELRERLTVGPSELGAFAADVATAGEAVVLATCGRTELYLADGDPSGAIARSVAVLANRAGLAPGELKRALYTVEDEEVVLHLFRVAAGLESPIPGESQILGQVREAHTVARAVGAEGPLLDRLFSHAIRTGKRVRSETTLGSQAASIPLAAAELARQVFGELTGRRVVIIGAGKMSGLAAASFVSSGMHKVLVANRTLASAERLARRFGGETIAFERLGDELERVDVVVSSTRCPRLILTVEQVADAITKRQRHPLLMIDIAVPRDIDPKIAHLTGCQLYDIDDLAEIARASAPDAEAGLMHAQAIVTEDAERFWRWLHSLAVVPAITSFRRKGEEIRTAELARAESELRMLSPAQRRAVDRLTARITSKLLHAPTVRAKESAVHADKNLHETMLRHLFGLDEEIA